MKNSTISGHIAAFLTVLVWGVTFVSTKILLETFTPLEILFLRFILGWLALWCIYPHLLEVKCKKDELLFIGAGLSGITIYFLLENIALVYTTASTVGILVSMAPFFTSLLAWSFLKAEKPKLNFFLGFILSITGIGLISINGFNLQLNYFGDILALLAALSWGVYSILTRKLALGGYGSLPATRRIFFYGLIFMLPLFWLYPLSFNIHDLYKSEYIGNLLFLGFGASAICFASWTYAIKHLGAIKASIYIYLVPIINLISASFILDEELTPISILGCCLTLGGLILAESKFYSKK